jgi:hypothetical protein
LRDLISSRLILVEVVLPVEAALPLDLAARKAGMSVAVWKCGCDPGYAKSKSATLLLGSLFVDVKASEKSLRDVLSSACISTPTVNSQFARFTSSFERTEVVLDSMRLFFASSLSSLRKGTVCS